MCLQLRKGDLSCHSPASSNKQVLPCDLRHLPPPCPLNLVPCTFAPGGHKARFLISLVCTDFSFMIKIQTSEPLTGLSRRTLEPATLKECSLPGAPQRPVDACWPWRPSSPPRSPEEGKPFKWEMLSGNPVLSSWRPH